MDPAEITRELERFDPTVAIDEAWTPPASWYVEPAILALEAEKVFARHWIVAARADQVVDPGSYVAGELIDRPYVVVRGEDGVLRAFHNVCRHHATVVMSGEGSCSKLVCPYHGWTYGLDGRLARAPRAGGIRDFDREDFGLVPLGVAEWGSLVFIHGDPGAAPPDSRFGELRASLDMENLTFVGRREYRLRCNWKVFVDNYLDGGYHVAVAHPDLASKLSEATYRTEIFDHHSIQTCESGGGDDRLGEGARYAWVHPNLMLNRYGPILDTNTVIPLGPNETLVVLEWFFEHERVTDQVFIEESLASSDTVQQEDVALCESVQRGLASPSYDRGRYAPKLEGAMLHFHQLLAGDLRAE